MEAYGGLPRQENDFTKEKKGGEKNIEATVADFKPMSIKFTCYVSLRVADFTS